MDFESSIEKLFFRKTLLGSQLLCRCSGRRILPTRSLLAAEEATASVAAPAAGNFLAPFVTFHQPASLTIERTGSAYGWRRLPLFRAISCRAILLPLVGA
jgi:hypothetical protein